MFYISIIVQTWSILPPQGQGNVLHLSVGHSVHTPRQTPPSPGDTPQADSPG